MSRFDKSTRKDKKRRTAALSVRRISIIILAMAALKVAKRSGVTRNTIHRLESFDDIPPVAVSRLLSLERYLKKLGWNSLSGLVMAPEYDCG
jgi:hypothetical protein